MNTIVFATHNLHKTKEINQIIKNLEVKSLVDINFFQDIKETGKTFAENAEIKAKTIYDYAQINVFADDSGLVIPALDGAPGIYSARYAGTGESMDNIKKVLRELHHKADRSAYFITVICLIFEGETHFFEGKVHGSILQEISGENGFGYDPIFKPEGYDMSFANFTAQEKNAISHRSIAVNKMNEFLMKKLQK